jgi:hypothetical protein
MPTINYQCSAITKHGCQCKNRVIIQGELCKTHCKNEPGPGLAQITNSFNTINIGGSVNTVGGSVNTIGGSVNTIGGSVNTFKPKNWTGVKNCGKNPDEMYKYLFPFP